MIEESKTQVIILTTALGFIQEDIAGIFDAAVAPSKEHNVQFQIITDVAPENVKTVERIDRDISEEKLNFKLRHVNMNSRFFPRFLIKDEEEAILAGKGGISSKPEDEGLWINDKGSVRFQHFVHVQMV
jgi:hypothetical protein